MDKIAPKDLGKRSDIVYRMFIKKTNDLFIFESHKFTPEDMGDVLKKYLEYAKIGDMFIIEVCDDSPEVRARREY